MGPNPSSGPRNSTTRAETSTAPVAVRDMTVLRHRGRRALSGGGPPRRHRTLCLQLLADYRKPLAISKHSHSGRGPNVRFVARPRTPRGRARETIARLADEYPGTEVELCA